MIPVVRCNHILKYQSVPKIQQNQCFHAPDVLIHQSHRCCKIENAHPGIGNEDARLLTKMKLLLGKQSNVCLQMELYSKKACELSRGAQEDDLAGSLSYLNAKEKDLLAFLLKKRLLEFTPIDVSKMLGVTNKTIINRCAKLTNNGFLTPNIVSQRIRSYTLSDFSKRNEKKIISMIE